MKKLFNFKKLEKDYYGSEREVLDITKIVKLSIIGLFLLITFFGSFKTVKSGEVGLKVRFGKIVDNTITEGINFKVPYIEKIVKVNIKIQKAELTTESSTKDLQTVQTKLAVNYRVENTKAPQLYKTVGNGYEDTVLIPAIQESIKAVMSKYTAEQTITDRNKVSDDCLNQIQEKMRKYGIVVEDFNIIDLDFSVEYSKAIEEKQVAEQKVLTAQQELEKEKIEAEKKITKAKGEADANALLQQTLTDQVLKEKFIEKWNGELPKVSGSDNMLDISSLIK